MKIPVISALDLVMVRQGTGPREAIARSVELARHVEKLGYYRFWVPEHHGVDIFASSSPAVLVGHIAGATRSIRVGTGGVMLLNHAPLTVAEQFGTLESIYPGRIDLGLGRAAGSSTVREGITKEALKRDPQTTGDKFPELLTELQHYLGPEQEGQQIKASPGQNTNVPVFLLSASGYSAKLAGELGLPFAFAAHIAPANLMSSVSLYREHFRPSKILEKPHVMISTFALAAETDKEAQKLFTTVQQLFLASIRNNPDKLVPPVESMDGLWTAEEKKSIEKKIYLAIVGGRETVAQSIRSLLQQTEADELILLSETFNDADRLRSYSILAETVASLDIAPATSDRRPA